MNHDVPVGQATPKIVGSLTADDSGNPKLSRQAIFEISRRYAHANFRKACWQLVDTFIPYGVLWAVMLYLDDDDG